MAEKKITFSEIGTDLYAFTAEGVRARWLGRMVRRHECDPVRAIVGWLQLYEPGGFEHDSESEPAGVEVSTLDQLVGHDDRV